MLQQIDLGSKPQTLSWDNVQRSAIWLDASNKKSYAAVTLCDLTRAKKTWRIQKLRSLSGSQIRRDAKSSKVCSPAPVLR